ncbi:MAG: hypothetical protein EOO73_11135 [Myxococcales bacterium]|nr:MAG: hypothetical protein EOO73_11135 [Myxococcales bacterium]
MSTADHASYEKRLVAGIATTMLALLGSSVLLLGQQRAPSAPEAKEQPFWSSDATASNLAVVELQRSSGSPWGQSPASP